MSFCFSAKLSVESATTGVPVFLLICLDLRHRQYTATPPSVPSEVERRRKGTAAPPPSARRLTHCTPATWCASPHKKRPAGKLARDRTRERPPEHSCASWWAHARPGLAAPSAGRDGRGFRSRGAIGRPLCAACIQHCALHLALLANPHAGGCGASCPGYRGAGALHTSIACDIAGIVGDTHCADWCRSRDSWGLHLGETADLACPAWRARRRRASTMTRTKTSPSAYRLISTIRPLLSRPLSRCV